MITDFKNKILQGDAKQVLKSLPDKCVNMCVTSPPYYALRSYTDSPDEIGKETSPDEYVQNLVDVFTEVKRVLRDDGTLWLNLGDTYNGKGHQGDFIDPKYPNGRTGQTVAINHKLEGYKRKDLIGIPWMVAFALRSSAWYLRQDIIWNKTNPLPEPVKDRCVKSHEYIFLLSKKDKYYFDYKAIQEPSITGDNGSRFDTGKTTNSKLRKHSIGDRVDDGLRNKRSVWTVNLQPLKDAHFAAYPEKLIEPCILAGCPEDGIVLDPFMGAGTTALVALKNHRNFVGIELNPEYIDIAENRIKMYRYSDNNF